jgi:hypothetical protein
MSREEILLKEYEVCQQESSSSADNFWTTIQIFTGVITAILAVVAYALATQPIPGWMLTLIVVFSLIVLAILVALYFWLQRVAFFIRIHGFRMQEIESELGMWRSRRIGWLDHWEKLSESDKRNLIESLNLSPDTKKEIYKSFDFNKIPSYYRPPKVGRIIIQNFLIILGIPWVIMIILAIIKYLTHN